MRRSRVVVQAVAGSNPVASLATLCEPGVHDRTRHDRRFSARPEVDVLEWTPVTLRTRCDVGWGPKGRWFKSSRPDFLIEGV
jgi:hypothetical protein